jgi:hypothetical protein
MAKNKKTKEVERVGMTPERAAEIAKETEGALASARKSEADRVARVGAAGVKGTERTAVEVDANPGVKFKKKIARDKKTGRAKVADVEARPTVGQEDQGPSAAPKIQLPGPVISTGRKLAQKGIRAPKRGELARGVTIVDPKPKKAKKKPTSKVVRDEKTGRIVQLPFRKKAPEEMTTTVVDTVAPAPERSRPTIAPGAGARREPVYVDTTKPEGNQASRKLKGLAVPHKVIAPAVNQALKHLDDMAATRGTTEHHGHAESFNAIHPTILGMDATIHHALGAVYHHTMYPKHNSSSVITQIKSAIGDRLSEGKKMETQRAQRQGRN